MYLLFFLRHTVSHYYNFLTDFLFPSEIEFASKISLFPLDFFAVSSLHFNIVIFGFVLRHVCLELHWLQAAQHYGARCKAFQFSTAMVSSPSVEVLKDHLPALTDGRGLARVDYDLAVVLICVANDFCIQAEVGSHMFNVRTHFTPSLLPISLFAGQEDHLRSWK